jgi:hypothetical protein
MYKVHARACSGLSPFRTLQKRIAADWTSLYANLVGPLRGS